KGLCRYAPEALLPRKSNNFQAINWSTFTPPRWPGFTLPLTILAAQHISDRSHLIVVQVLLTIADRLVLHLLGGDGTVLVAAAQH
ncbi:MAG: hypothetical protein ABR905_10620, partial [Terracidiphilus sp.]